MGKKNIKDTKFITAINKTRFFDFKAFHDKNHKNNYSFQDYVKRYLKTFQDFSICTFNKAVKIDLIQQILKLLMAYDGRKINPLCIEMSSYPLLHKRKLLKLQRETTPRLKLTEEFERSKNQIKKRCLDDFEGLLDASVIFRTLTAKITSTMSKNSGFTLKNLSRNSFVLAIYRLKDHYANRWKNAIKLMELSGIISFHQKSQEKLYLHNLP